MSAKPLHTSLSPLHNFITEKISLTEEEWLFVAERLEMISIKANTLLLREGQVCQHLYFVNKGLMRFFITT
jgi:CRP-like cAMP-binding protein